MVLGFEVSTWWYGIVWETLRRHIRVVCRQHHVPGHGIVLVRLIEQVLLLLELLLLLLLLLVLK